MAPPTRMAPEASYTPGCLMAENKTHIPEHSRRPEKPIRKEPATLPIVTKRRYLPRGWLQRRRVS